MNEINSMKYLKTYFRVHEYYEFEKRIHEFSTRNVSLRTSVFTSVLLTYGILCEVHSLGLEIDPARHRKLSVDNSFVGIIYYIIYKNTTKYL